jgi:hypothetical protein
MAKDHNLQWKVVLQKKSRSTCCVVDSVIDSNSIDDYAPWLNIPLLTPPTKDSTIVDEIIRRRQEEEQG